MNREDAEEFTQSLGQIVGGSWRQIALAKRLGVPQALSMDTDDWVRQRLGGYVRLNVEDRREAVRELAAEGMSQREIASVIGTSHMTVDRDLDAVTNVTPEPENEATPVTFDTTGPASSVASPIAEKRKAGEDARKAVLEAPADPEILPGIYAEDFFIGASRIADESVDLIFTDPPYDEVPLNKAAAVVDLPKSEQLKAATQTASAPFEDGVPEYTPDDAEEEAALARATAQIDKSIDVVMASDDRFPALKAEIKRLAGLLSIAEGSRDHYQNQAGQAVRALKAEQRKTAALEKKLAKSRGEIEALQERIALMEVA